MKLIFYTIMNNSLFIIPTQVNVPVIDCIHFLTYSTGSVPHTPSSVRKTQQVQEEPPPRRTSLQRSHTIGSGSAPTLPNKNLLRGPQMSVCCDCKTMIMEIIRTSRTSIALIHKGQEAPPTPTKEEEKEDGLNLSTLSLNIKQFFNK